MVANPVPRLFRSKQREHFCFVVDFDFKKEKEWKIKGVSGENYTYNPRANNYRDIFKVTYSISDQRYITLTIRAKYQNNSYHHLTNNALGP